MTVITRELTRVWANCGQNGEDLKSQMTGAAHEVTGWSRLRPEP